MRVPIDKVTAAIEEVAAREVMPRFRALAKHEVRAKENGELVTSADLACENALCARLLSLLAETTGWALWLETGTLAAASAGSMRGSSVPRPQGPDKNSFSPTQLRAASAGHACQPTARLG